MRELKAHTLCPEGPPFVKKFPLEPGMYDHVLRQQQDEAVSLLFDTDLLFSDVDGRRGANISEDARRNAVTVCVAADVQEQTSNANQREPTSEAQLGGNNGSNGDCAFHFRDSFSDVAAVIDVTRFGDLGKLLRVTAYVLRFVGSKSGNPPRSLEISGQEMEQSQTL